MSAAAIVIVAGLWMWRSRSAPPVPPEGPQVAAVPENFRFERVSLVSSDLEVGLVEIRGTVHPEYTDWACILDCRESDGCHAEVQLTIAYESAGAMRKLVLGGRLDADSGQMMRIGRTQRPPVAVETIDRVKMTVTESRRSDSPRPTEIE